MRTNRSLLWMLLAAVPSAACASAGSERDALPSTGPDSLAGPVAGADGSLVPTGVVTDPVTGEPVGTTAPAGSGGDVVVNETGLPCDVSTVVQNNCSRCHGAQPVGGAVRLVTHEDWHEPSPVYAATRLGDPAMKVHEVARLRINNGEMPQGASLSEPDHAMLDGWLASGAPAGAADDATCTIVPTMPATGGDGEALIENECLRPGAYDPLVARPGETCYEFRVHGQSGVGDTSKFNIPTGESYHEWYYEVPWAPTDVMSRFGADFDNLEVLHHYLMFASNTAGKVPGQLDQNVTGTTLFTNSTLIGGWAVGGCSMEMPEDVGGELPKSSLLMIQWHMYNSTGVTQQDGSVVQICTVPAGSRPNTAGITFLGTENFNGPFGMPPGANSFTSRCTNNSPGPVTVIGFLPHMHTIGTHMKTDLTRLDGTTATIFDRPFQFDYQVAYRIPRTVVMPGETLTSTCSFFNDTGGNVAFGQSTQQEMCYQFTVSYPVGALNNGVPSLIGALNTCW